jgi:hypothetical protein
LDEPAQALKLTIFFHCPAIYMVNRRGRILLQIG